MRRAVPLLSLALLLGACAGNAPPPPRARTVASARSAGPAGARGRGQEGPPAVDSAARCPNESFATLARLRRGRTLHGQPLCTEVFNGRFAAVLATGTEQEATDVWTVFHNGNRDEVHRVRHWPVGARIRFGRIAQGWVYLLGDGLAREDMPASTRLLAIFPLPRPGGEAPTVSVLSPLEAGLLRANDPEDLERRLGFEVPTQVPTQALAQSLVQRIAQGGPDALFEHLTPEGAPTLRAWQPGMFQETDYVSPQGDPTNPHVANALTLLREIARAMDCSAGDRCLARPERPLPDGASPAQVLLRYDGRRVVIAAFIAPTVLRPPGDVPPRAATLGRPESDQADDVTLASALALDGQVQGPVVAAPLGDARVLAFLVTRADGVVEPRVYVTRTGAAPRGYIDPSLGRADSQELQLRDYDRDGGFELVSLGRRGDTPIVSIASAVAPPRVFQHQLIPRLDMLRAAFGANTLAEIDARLRAFTPNPAEPAEACATLDRLAELNERTVLAATRGALTVIDYPERGQPLRGTVRRPSRRELTRGASELFGPFAGQRCADLRCDFGQSYCRPGAPGAEGVLWFGEGGRRIAAVSRHTP